MLVELPHSQILAPPGIGVRYVTAPYSMNLNAGHRIGVVPYPGHHEIRKHAPRLGRPSLSTDTEPYRTDLNIADRTGRPKTGFALPVRTSTSLSRSYGCSSSLMIECMAIAADRIGTFL